MPELHVLRVFCGEDGGGNPLGVFLEGGEVPGPRRQEVARRLGFSETVFVDDPPAARSRSSPRAPSWTSPAIPRSAPPGCSTARLRRSRRFCAPPAGECPRGRTPMAPTWRAGPKSGDRRSSSRNWGLLTRSTLSAVRPAAIRPRSARGRGSTRTPGSCAHACSSTASGSRRTRPPARPPQALAANAGRPIDIRQGRGSRILARPLDGGMVEIGGRVVLDEVREL